MNRKETLAVLQEFGIQPSRSLGQNFLTDDRIISQICDAAGITPSDLVVEIGPGIGGLTRELARRAGHVAALEIDRHVLPALKHTLAEFTNCSIYHADALKVNLAELCSGWPGPVKIVANLPYYITTPLLTKMFCELPGSHNWVFMIQKEAAGRLMARPGCKQYGPLAVLAACLGTVARVASVPASAFVPVPAVDSCVICISPDRQLQISDWPAFQDFLNACFGRRRRTLANNLKVMVLSTGQSELISQALETIGLSGNVRAERLRCEQFVALYQFFFEKRLEFDAE
ncbi:MAG TPA: ribosomal RNA small subunit methyltransferase A [Clostridiales bacterium]|nr:ribosomal RNA small subunit methyltransferase A [Clostridiales bacterium]